MGCFLIGVTGKEYTTSGEALLGSVSDDPYDVRTFVRSHHPQGRLSHVGTELVTTRPPSFAERGYFCQDGDTSRGVNSAGLAFTCAILFENETLPKKEKRISFSILTKEIMELCRNVPDALKHIQNAGAVEPPFSILLADSEGRIAHVEAGGFGVEVVHQFSTESPGAVFAVNCYQSKRSTKHNNPAAGSELSTNNNGVRLQRGQELSEKWKGRIDKEVLAKILSDHANRERDPETNPLLDAWGFSICNHGTRKSDQKSDRDLPWGTVSGEILQPKEKTLHYCYGWPCGEKPEFGDQLYQENSWGNFRPFTIRDNFQGGHVNMLTTPEGAEEPQ